MLFKENTITVLLKGNRIAKIVNVPVRLWCHIQKLGPEIRNFWGDRRPKTRDPSHAWDSRPRTLKVGLETRDPGSLLIMGPKTQDTETWTWNPYDRWHPRLKTSICYRVWDAGTMIQIDLIKCSRNTTRVIIFLIFNHIIKRLQHL